jgi:hypothetical protein
MLSHFQILINFFLQKTVVNHAYPRNLNCDCHYDCDRDQNKIKSFQIHKNYAYS